LEDLLDEDGMDETLSFIDDETLNRCLDLRTSLSKHKAKFESAASKPPTSLNRAISMSYDFQNIPKSVSPFSITPWKSSTILTSLPTLPKVLDPTLEASAFVHQHLGSNKPTDLSYERLEWVGDAYLEVTATLLISQTFPALSPGKMSQLRERLVKNLTLADFARRYGFDKRARLPSHMSNLNSYEMTKVLGDIFEAYVAAVILSDPTDGVRRVSEWLKELWGQTLQKEIIDEERSAFKLDSPMWRLRGQVGPPEKIEIVDKTQIVPLNPKEQLQAALGAKGVKIRYEDVGQVKKDPKNKLPLFTVGVYLDGWGEKNKLLGTGQANGKKDAGFRAAEFALSNKKMMKAFAEKKKVYDAQMQLEREALAKAGENM
jgi:ribonuclease-3